jgi:hypothetical protein
VSQEDEKMTDHIAYVADKPRDLPTADELRARIPGWGSDLDLADRPSVPKLSREAGGATGAHWEKPSQQPGGAGRERSIEHAHLTPVFGTAQPLRGLAGVVRRYAYRRYSEGRLAHWMLLVLGDRLDVATHRLTDALRGRPDDLIGETGIGAERGKHSITSRLGSTRPDTHHTWMDPFVANWPGLVVGGVLLVVVRRLLRRR